MQIILKRLTALLYVLLPLMGGGLAGVSCTESEDESENEYANWRERNEAFLATLADSLKGGTGNWVRYKHYAKDPDKEGAATDYIYVKKISSGASTVSPMYTDSVRLSYEGRLLPTKNYPEGPVFDGTVYGNYNGRTNATARFLVSGVIVGWTTALLHMHKGDHWRVYVPSELGYGESGNGTIPGYSVLIFDITLVDMSPAGQAMPKWSTRRFEDED